MSKPIFIAILRSGKQFRGGNSYDDSKWNDIKEPLDKLYDTLPDGNILVHHNFEKYNHIIEKTQNFNMKGQQIGKERIEYVYIMGKRGDIVTSYRITMFHGKPGKDKYRRGDILRREFPWQKMSKKYSGWK